MGIADPDGSVSSRCNTGTGQCMCGAAGAPCDAASTTPQCLLAPVGAAAGVRATAEADAATCQVG